MEGGMCKYVMLLAIAPHAASEAAHSVRTAVAALYQRFERVNGGFCGRFLCQLSSKSFFEKSRLLE
jgi:hypothetical protein